MLALAHTCMMRDEISGGLQVRAELHEPLYTKIFP